MESKKFLVRLIIVVLFFFVLGAGVGLYKRFFPSKWSDDGIRGIKDGCLLLEQSPEFCECYTREIVNRISMKDFIELTKNMKINENERARAKKFIDSVIAHCSEPQ